MDPEITLRLPLSKVNVLLAGLGELPLKIAADTFAAVREQAGRQVAPAAPAQADAAPS